ncbi:MAG: 3-deoxy-manno-octulosonate cytidylyltransferase [Marinilabiliales bacterium]
MQIIGIIPARYNSPGIPGKPLLKIGNKPVIQRVYEQSIKVLDKVFIAADDERITSFIRNIGGEAILTSKLHKNGTERCREAAGILMREKKQKFDVIINIPADYPFIYPQQIECLVNLINNNNVDIGTLIKPINNKEDIFDDSIIKVILNKYNEIIYLSHSSIPYIQKFKKQKNSWTKYLFYKHIPVYGYKTDVLDEIGKLESSYLENTEKIEPLRWIENGYKISAQITEFESPKIKTRKDIENLNQISLI